MPNDEEDDLIDVECNSCFLICEINEKDKKTELTWKSLQSISPPKHTCFWIRFKYHASDPWLIMKGSKSFLSKINSPYIEWAID